MRIAIISDTHDNIWKLDSAMPQLARADAIIHCGDICSPFVVKQLGEGLQDIPVHIVWGNNDGDHRLLMLTAAQAGNIHIHGEFADLTLGGLKVAVSHYPEIARPIAESGRYDLVCYGHDHTANEEEVGRTLLLNPGEMMGMKGRSSLVLFTTAQKKVVWVDIN